MKPHFMFKANRTRIVRHTGITISIRQILRDQKQADTLCSRHRIRQTCQNQMAYILGDIVIAPANENLLAGHRVGTITIILGLSTQRPDIGSSPRLRQVHRPRPLPRNQLRQVQRLKLVTRMMLQRLDLALRHKRVQRQRQTRAAHHLANA